ncbi:MAG: S-layer homology domain-containing protein [Clostridia bacterium]|nr:S-layer homology domain-containing protein [Clostridia bacterium]
MKKFIGLAVIAAIILNMGSVFAQEAVTVEVNNRNVTVSGTDATPNGRVTLQVYLGENTAETLETLTPARYLEVLVCHDQTRANAEGEYTFSFDIENKTYDYTAFIKTEGSGSTIKKVFPFVNMAEFKDIVDDINASTSDTITGGLIVANKEVFGLSQEEVAGINIGNFAKIIYNYTAEGNQFSNTDRTAVLGFFDYAYFIQQLNENAISNMYLCPEVNGLSGSSIAQWYNQAFVTEALKTDFTGRMSGRNFSEVSQYENALMEAFMLAVVENPNGFANIVSVASAFATQLGIPTDKITDANCQRVAGNDYPTIAKFIEALTPVAGGAPLGGGGGGGGGAITTPVEMPAPKPVEEPLPAKIFEDLNGYDWAETAIVELAERGIVNGKGKDKFHPADFVTREEFVKMLVTALKIPASTEELRFSDADKQGWYYEYLQTAVAAGIVKGKDDGTFGIGEKISRQDMAHMAYQALLTTQTVFDGTVKDTFADDAGIADYAKASVYALKNKGVINGIGENRYEPLAYSERAAAAKVIYMLITL